MFSKLTRWLRPRSSHAPTRRTPPSTRLGLDFLEDRYVPANLTITDARIADANHQPLANVRPGDQVFIRADYATTGLAPNSSYRISYTVNGATKSTNFTSLGSGYSSGTWYFTWGMWPAAAGTNQVSVTIDPDRTVPETTYADNTRSFSFNASAPAPNIAATNVTFVNANNLPYATMPKPGDSVYIRADFTTQNLPSNASYRAQYTVNGVTRNTGVVNWGAGTAARSWNIVTGPWTIYSGATQVTVNLNPDRSVAESTFADNSKSLSFTINPPVVGNIAVKGVQLVNSAGQPVLTARAGETVFVQTTYTTQNLASNAQYRISHSLGGTVMYSNIYTWGAGDSNTRTWTTNLGPWTVPVTVSGTIEPTVTVNPDRQFESAYIDNFATTRIPVSTFDVDVRMYGTPTASQQALIRKAADTWSRVILNDLPAFAYPGSVMQNMRFAPTTVDDVLMEVMIKNIDGRYGILGSTDFDLNDPTSKLPRHSLILLDSSDLNGSDTDFYYTVLHEMGHALGFNKQTWVSKGLLVGAGGANPIFIGPNAIREYIVLTHSNATSVPVENTGPAGTRDSHWRQTILKNELMTGTSAGGVTPMSRLTIASMADLGYNVNLNMADPFSI